MIMLTFSFGNMYSSLDEESAVEDEESAFDRIRQIPLVERPSNVSRLY